MPMHLRYGSWLPSPLPLWTPGYSTQANPNALVYLMVQGKAEKTWTWRDQICSTFLSEANLHGIMLLHERNGCTLLKQSWRCGSDEQMQEVSLVMSLVSPLLVSIADSGDKLVKSVADLLCSFTLDVDCWRAWLILNTWSKVEVKKRSSGCHDCHILGQVPVETTAWKESDSKSNETKQRAQALWTTPSYTNLIFWYSGGWGFSSLSRFGAGETSTNKQSKLIGSVQTMGWGTLAIFLNLWKSRQIKHRICTSSVSRRLLFLRNGRLQPRLQCVHLQPTVCTARIQEPRGRDIAWAFDPKKNSLMTRNLQGHILVWPQLIWLA